jgi:predicted RNA-binding Zn-ribbon protein involved in translation (DUF1610 family)
MKTTIERLYHFTCFACNGTWSVSNWKYKITFFCPHCGIQQSVAVVVEDDEQ